jgi:hypothetical protein
MDGSEESTGQECNGIEEERARFLGVEFFCPWFSYYSAFVKRDSYPEICAQRTDEGGGFLYCAISLVRRVDAGAL